MSTRAGRGRARTVAEHTRTYTAQAVRPARAPKAPKPPKPMSATQRHTLATEGIVRAIGATDKKTVQTAALEFVHERLAYDAGMRETLRQKYEELTALSPSKTKQDLGPAPVPIKGHGIEGYSPYAKYDPYQLVEDYGRDQLRAVLIRATPKRLKEAVEIVHAREPVTKLPNRSRNADMIEYIIEHVAGSGY